MTRSAPSELPEAEQCWPSAEALARDGRLNEAMKICQSPNCAHVADCQRFLGWAYYDRSEYGKAVKWFAMAAAQGDGGGEFGLACTAFAQSDFVAAHYHYLIAVGQGQKRANYWLAYLYQQGLGVQRNLETAVSYYRRASDAGYLIAERARIHLALRNGSLAQRIDAVARLPFLILKAALIALRNVRDERLADIRNPFLKR